MKLRFRILTLAAALLYVGMVCAAAPGVSDTEIRLGMVNAQTGDAAGLGQGMRAGAEPLVPPQLAGEGAQPSMPDASAVISAQVLLVEDNEINREIALAMLEGTGYQVTVAINGRHALAAYQDGEFDMVLMDCQMPEMDGFEAVRCLRQFEHGTARRRTPVVALTANAISGDRERCLGAGMDKHIAKPFTRAALLSALAHWTQAPAAAALSALGQEPQASAAGTTEVHSLDPGALQSLRALCRPGRPDVLTRIINLFNSDAPRLLGELHKAVDASDAEAMRHAAHTLKSTCANVGATTLAATCRDFEQCARMADVSGATAHVDGIQQELERVLAALAQERVAI
jgi:CheY-like chemotaxis protein